MSDSMISRLPDPDMQAAPRALLRAAHRAREIARQTNTAIVIVRDGQLIEEVPTESGDAIAHRGSNVIHDGD